MKRTLEENESEEAGNAEEDDGEKYEEACPVQCWDQAVTVTDALIRDAETLWDRYGGDKKVAKSFWVEADAEPRCLVESTALQIADFHLQGAEYAGVEIWTQFRAENAIDRGLDFHFDKDERMAANEKVWKHPVVGTATYLTTGGAPLVVFATASPEGEEHEQKDGPEGEEKSPSSESSPKRPKTDKDSRDIEDKGEDSGEDNPSHAWICYPVKGRHVAFAGNLLHGVTEELIFKDKTDRLSLLVNIWLDHKPHTIEYLSDDMIAKLDLSVEGACVLESNGERKEPMDVFELEALDPLVELKEHVPGDTAPLPTAAIRKQVEEGDVPPVLQISYST